MSYSGRVRVFEDQAELTIEIGQVRDWRLLLPQVWSVFAFMALPFALGAILFPVGLPGRPPLFLLAVGILSAVLAVVNLARLIWLAFGLEQIVFRGGLLSVERRLGLLAFSRTYRLNEVRDFHAALRYPGSFHVIRGRIRFQYQGRRRRMADRIDRTHAKELVRLLREWLPRELWTPVLGL